MRHRIKQVREALDMNQETFGKGLGITKSGVSNIESGTRSVNDKHIRMLNLTYNVNPEWLRSGNGDMFSPTDNSILSQLQKQHHLSPAALSLLNNFFSLTSSEQDEFITLAGKVFDLGKDD